MLANSWAIKSKSNISSGFGTIESISDPFIDILDENRSLSNSELAVVVVVAVVRFVDKMLSFDGDCFLDEMPLRNFRNTFIL